MHETASVDRVAPQVAEGLRHLQRASLFQNVQLYVRNISCQYMISVKM